MPVPLVLYFEQRSSVSMNFHLCKRMCGGKTTLLLNHLPLSSPCTSENTCLIEGSFFLIFDYYFRNEHPIVPIIKEHRTLAKLLNSTLGSICSLARLSVSTQKYTLHGHWLQTSTATGRLSMEEPNLQVWVLLSHVLFCLFLFSAYCYI